MQKAIRASQEGQVSGACSGNCEHIDAETLIACASKAFYDVLRVAYRPGAEVCTACAFDVL